jgi:hypothetical protein
MRDMRAPGGVARSVASKARDGVFSNSIPRLHITAPHTTLAQDVCNLSFGRKLHKFSYQHELASFNTCALNTTEQPSKLEMWVRFPSVASGCSSCQLGAEPERRAHITGQTMEPVPCVVWSPIRAPPTLPKLILTVVSATATMRVWKPMDFKASLNSGCPHQCPRQGRPLPGPGRNLPGNR